MKTLISKREFEVLQLIAYEYSTKQIATQLFICYETAHTHRKSLLRKLNAKNAAGLVRRAFEFGLLRLDRQGQAINNHVMQRQILQAS